MSSILHDAFAKNYEHISKRKIPEAEMKNFLFSIPLRLSPESEISQIFFVLFLRFNSKGFLCEFCHLDGKKDAKSGETCSTRRKI